MSNQLEITVSRNGPDPSWPANALHLQVQVDDHRLGADFVVDFRELYRTLRYSSEMWLWTSVDGEPLEAGIETFVAVHRHDNGIRWEWFSPLRACDLDPGQPRDVQVADFELAAYDRAIHRAWWSICSLLNAEHSLEVLPRRTRRDELLSLPRWIESEQARPWQGEFLTTSLASLV